MKSKIHWYYGCGWGRPCRGDISPGQFLSDASKNPDWFCVTCAAKARLALAAESAPKPSDVVWPKPRPISEAPINKIILLGQLVRERPACGDRRTDSDRYAELRNLVEAWQSHIAGSSQSLADWSHR